MINSIFILALQFTFKYLVWFLWTNVDVGSRQTDENVTQMSFGDPVPLKGLQIAK